MDELKKLDGEMYYEVATKYLGITGEFPMGRITMERIIAGKEIEAWDRESWPWGMFSGGGGYNEKNKISGSLGFLDFYKIRIGKLKTMGFEEDIVEFPYLGNDALNINALGIEPSGVTRIRNDTRIEEGKNPKTLIIRPLLQELEDIAKERNIPIITVSSDSIYNFYSDGDIPNELVKNIYNSPHYDEKFHQQFTYSLFPWHP